MARIRTIKPEFFTSEQVAECSPTARLLFIGMWSFSDDRGVHSASAMRLKMEIFPADDISANDVQALVDELKRVGLVAEFETDGDRFLYVTGWNDHQRIEKPTFRFPPPPSSPQFDEESSTPRRTIDDPSEIPPPRNGMEGNGRDNDTNPPLPPKGGGSPPEVDESPQFPDRPRRSRKPKFDPRTAEIPPGLSEPAFADAWNRWCDHRAEIRKPLTRTTTDQQLRDFAGWGVHRAIAAINNTIGMGWTGLREPENAGVAPLGSRPPAVPATTGAAAGPLLEVTAEQATDPAEFDAWFHRQQTFDQDEKTRTGLHAVRCSVQRIQRRPAVARDELQARLENLAAGRQLIDPPRYEDRQQASRELAQLAVSPGTETAPAESRDLLPIGGAA